MAVRHAAFYAAGLGLLVAGWVILDHMAGWRESQAGFLTELVPYVLAIVGIGIILRRLARRSDEHTLKYSSLLGAGTVMALVISVFFAAASFVSTSSINPDYSDYIMNQHREHHESVGIHSDVIMLELNMQRPLAEPEGQTGLALLSMLFFGFIASLAYAAIFSRERHDEAHDST